MKKIFLTFLILAKIIFFSYSQNKDSIQIFDIKLDSLVKIKVNHQGNKILSNSASFRPFNLKIIKNKQLKYLATLDLLEILRTIPNIQINSEPYNQISFSYNGIWSKNGRILLIYDGHPMNFNLFGNLILLRHYPVNNLKNIVFKKIIDNNNLYNFNELTAIKINTKIYKKQFFIYSNTEFSLKTFPLTENFDLVFNRPLAKNLRLSLNFRYQYNYRNLLNYRGLNRAFTPESAKITDLFFHFDLFNQTTKFSILFDQYQRIDSPNYFNLNNTPQYFMTFSSYFDKYKHITPRLAVRMHILFQINTPQASYLSNYYNIDFSKQFYPKIYYFKYFARAIYYKQKNLRLTFSLNINNQAVNTQNNFLFNPGVQKSYIISQIYIFNTTAHYKFDKFLITPGINLVFDNLDNRIIAPRLSIIFSFDKFKIQQIFAKTYRMPTIGDLIFANQQPGLNHIDILSPETFYSVINNININFSTNFSLNISSSFSSSHRAHNFYFTDNGKATFINIGKYGTLSLDVTESYIFDKFKIDFSAAFYRPLIRDSQELHYFSDSISQYLGVSNVKLSGNFFLNLKKAKLYISTIYIGDKYGYELKPDSSLVLKHYNPTLLISPNIVYNFKKFQINFSIYNLLNSRDYFVQPYKSTFSPMPYLGRTIRFGLKYKF